MARTHVGVRILDEQLQAIDEIAERERRSRSNVIEVLIAEALAARRRSRANAERR